MAARTYKYFSGDVELDIKRHRPMRNAEFAEKFPGIKGVPFDGISKFVAPALGAPRGSKWSDDLLLPMTRVIHYSKQPSLHKCDARCMGAKGHNCECSCGGKNHGIKR